MIIDRHGETGSSLEQMASPTPGQASAADQLPSLRIAFVGQRGIPATFGGIEHHVEQLGAGLAIRGHDVTVYCRTNYTARRPAEYQGMRLRHLPTIDTKHLDAIVHSSLATVAALRGRFDIIHYHGLGPGLLAPLPRYLSRSRVVLTVHALDYERAKWGRLAQAVLRTGGWMSGRVPDSTIAVSQALVLHYASRHRRLVAHIPNGVRPPTFRPAAAVSRRFRLEESGYVLFVGRLVPEKAPDLLIRAFRHLPQKLKLVIAGGSSFSDRYVEKLRALAAADSRVVLTGPVFASDLEELYSNATAFVAPSALEGLPLTLLEAASYGVPVVASAIDPHIEVLGADSAGHRLFPPGDVNGLVTSLRCTLADPQGERRGAEEVRLRVLTDYSWEQTAEATEALYRRVLAAPLLLRSRTIV